MKKYTFILISIIVLTSCSAKLITNHSSINKPLELHETITVFGLTDSIPVKSKELGELKIVDSGFSLNCGWNTVIKKAKEEARAIGGNAIKIIYQNYCASGLWNENFKITMLSL